LLSSASFALYSLLGRLADREQPALTFVGVSCVGGALAALPLAALELAAGAPRPGALSWAMAGYLGAVVTFAGFGVRCRGLRRGRLMRCGGAATGGREASGAGVGAERTGPGRGSAAGRDGPRACARRGGGRPGGRRRLGGDPTGGDAGAAALRGLPGAAAPNRA